MCCLLNPSFLFRIGRIICFHERFNSLWQIYRLLSIVIIFHSVWLQYLLLLSYRQDLHEVIDRAIDYGLTNTTEDAPPLMAAFLKQLLEGTRVEVRHVLSVFKSCSLFNLDLLIIIHFQSFLLGD